MYTWVALLYKKVLILFPFVHVVESCSTRNAKTTISPTSLLFKILVLQYQLFFSAKCQSIDGSLPEAHYLFLETEEIVQYCGIGVLIDEKRQNCN